MPTAFVTRVIAAPQHDVWALISDISQAGRWNRFWSKIEFTSPQTHGAGTRFRATTSSGDSFEFEVCEWEAPQRIAFCPIREPGERYNITLESHVFEVRAVSADACEVTVTAHASASGLRGRIMAMFFWASHQRDGLEAALDSLQSVFEPEEADDDAGASSSRQALPE
ncbi:MAG TPA: SRPBCC family protein [Dehalococcoidia bacterium]|jgi:uncharacterized protein YndB with AHSA1/START domain|nr:SRPBCC family protein [Dehalococcoidia bacterium]